ncbi:MAG: hypothetical protein ACU0CC_16820 [Sagittula sp.]|uniref:hypothetical protein n=1 Tax=unclassified Sagittula TaxID=2624628 RepID=UPI000C2D0D4C|nr:MULTISPECIES: hypothetical protein [unclassified Sagittula]AUC55117.1 hypothetical protein CDO87_18955 [Sagittula sp. P11]WHZ33480.1 hypothetical protein QNI11_12550 [Sagittula sp. MA-2]
MSAFWDLLFSPAGLVLYAGFWALKIVAGAWVLSKLVLLLPARMQVWAEDKLVRLRLMKRKVGPLG